MAHHDQGKTWFSGLDLRHEDLEVGHVVAERGDLGSRAARTSVTPQIECMHRKALGREVLRKITVAGAVILEPVHNQDDAPRGLRGTPRLGVQVDTAVTAKPGLTVLDTLDRLRSHRRPNRRCTGDGGDEEGEGEGEGLHDEPEARREWGRRRGAEGLRRTDCGSIRTRVSDAACSLAVPPAKPTSRGPSTSEATSSISSAFQRTHQAWRFEA